MPCEERVVWDMGLEGISLPFLVIVVEVGRWETLHVLFSSVTSDGQGPWVLTK